MPLNVLDRYEALVRANDQRRTGLTQDQLVTLTLAETIEECTVDLVRSIDSVEF